jgi:XTP/dITP diphosphohydrolase
MLDLKLQTIVLATRNIGKLKEFLALLAPLKCRILSLEEASIDRDIEETGRTFAENARLKALEYSRLTHLPVLADDSGLEVPALGNRPGVYSARYAGPGASDSDRNQKLLEELETSGSDRSARFFCALALAEEGRILLEATGECRGIIAFTPRGTNGFGYDPVFFLPERDKTFAELSLKEKNEVSHRTRAIRNLIDQVCKQKQSKKNATD